MVSYLRWPCSLVVAFAEAGFRSLSRTICAATQLELVSGSDPLYPSSQTPDKRNAD